MRKLVLIIAVLLITVTSADAQRRRHNRKGYDRIERIERRADNLTESMVKAFNLNDKQKSELFELNKKWIDSGYHGRDNKATGYEYCGDYNKKNRDSDHTRYATPTLYPELRARMMTQRVSDYKASLKKIMTSSQFKSYEKRVADEIADISKKY